MSKINVNTWEPEGSSTDAVMMASSDTVTVPSGAELDIASGATLDVNGTIDVTGATTTGFPTNTPSFGAYLAANQAYTNEVWTKITMDTEEWDTDSAFDHATNYRFTVPAGKGGKYSFSVTSTMDSVGGGDAMQNAYLALYKNGSLFKEIRTRHDYQHEWTGVMFTAVLDLAATDYIEFYAQVDTNAGTGTSLGGQSLTFCSGYKLL